MEFLFNCGLSIDDTLNQNNTIICDNSENRKQLLPQMKELCNQKDDYQPIVHPKYVRLLQILPSVIYWVKYPFLQTSSISSSNIHTSLLYMIKNDCMTI